MKTKIQLINAAFSELKISGITSGPTPEDVELALEVLEDLMHETSVKLPFNFEDAPDPNTESGIPDFANRAIQLKLASTLGPHYGKGIDPRALSGAWAKLVGRVAVVNGTSSSSRMPLGRGNNASYPCDSYFPGQIPPDPSARMLSTYDAISVSANFDDYMKNGETVASYVLTADSQLTYSADALSANTVSMLVTASAATGNFRIKIAVTGTLSTKVNRYLYFTVTDGIAVNR